MIYKYKTEGMSPKYFGNYQNPIDLFKNLRDGNTNPKEVLQNQINSDLLEIKKVYPNLKSNHQVSVIQNVENLFHLRNEIINFFRDYSFLLSEAKYKAKYGRA